MKADIVIYVRSKYKEKVEKAVKPLLEKLSKSHRMTSQIKVTDYNIKPTMDCPIGHFDGLDNILRGLHMLAVPVRVPNDARSIENRWYDFNGQYKIVRPKDGKDKEYRIVIKFPTKARVGIYPKELQLTGLGSHDWGCYYYNATTEDVPSYIQEVLDSLKSIANHLDTTLRYNRYGERDLLSSLSTISAKKKKSRRK